MSSDSSSSGELSFTKSDSKASIKVGTTLVLEPIKNEEPNKDVKIDVRSTVDYPVTIQFRNVGYVAQEVQPNKSWVPDFLTSLKTVPKTILTDINGIVKPGEILTILGKSGCGKTSLLNLLSGRIVQGLTGEIKINGRDDKLSDYKRQIAYITQHDQLISNLTVRQNLSFTAQLHLPEEEQSQVTTNIDRLGLTKRADTFIGGATVTFVGANRPGISGGERKRTAIANELLINPSLIIFDEPTSGLDATNAFELFTVMRELANSGHTIITVLHQPSSAMFSKFDKLMLMAEGRVVYFGKASEAVDYLTTQGFKCPQYYNPAEFMLDLVSGPEVTALVKAHRPPEAQVVSPGPPPPKRNEDQGRPGWFKQVKILTHRQWLLKWHSIDIFPYIPVFIVAIIMGLYWWQRKMIDSDIFNRNSALFLAIVFAVGFEPLFNSMNTFYNEKMTLIRERASGSYYLSAYLVAIRLAAMPFELIPLLLFVPPFYFMIGFRADAHFLLHFVIMILCGYTSAILGICVAAFFTNFKSALTFVPIYVLSAVMICGLYIKITELPKWIGWAAWCSPYRYAYEALVYNEYIGRSVEITPEGGFFSQATLASLGNATVADSSLIFKELGMKIGLAREIGALLGYLGFGHVLAYVLMFFFVR